MKKMITASLFVLVIVFNVVILKPTTEGKSGQLQVPDVTFAYDGQTIYHNYFLQLEPEKIPALKKIMYWDYVYPVIYTAFLFLIGQFLFSHGLYKRVYLTAVFAAFLFDYAENITQLYLLNQLPKTHIGLASIMGMFTTLKWVTALFSLLSVLTALAWAGMRKLAPARQN